jgi:hypothetical protein
MQLVAGVAGAAIGFVASGGNPLGAQLGFAAGSTLFGLFGPKPPSPGPGELKRPQTTLGAQIPRVYGQVRRPVQIVWASRFRATEVEQEGGKGTPEGPSSFTYSLDLLCWLADGDNVVAVSRIWVNNKLVWTALADSPEESITASEETTSWDDVTFFPGTAGQVPWPVYEDAVGADVAPAMRGVASIGFENFQCGTSQQVPLIEVEVLTSADTGTINEPPLERLFEFDYTGFGNQFGNADFGSPLRIVGEGSPANDFVTFYSYASPNGTPQTTDTVGVSPVGSGGITPQGGVGDTAALLFCAGDTLYGYYPGLVSYTHSTADLTNIQFSYAFRGSDLYVCTSASELYRYNRSTGGNELASNASADICRTIIIVGDKVYGAAPFTTDDLIEWDADTLAETGRWALDPDSVAMLCTDGESVFDFRGAIGTVQMIRFNGSTWDVVVASMGEMDGYLSGSGNFSNPVLRDGYVYLSRPESPSGTAWLLMRARYELTSYAPLPVDLQDIVDAELTRVQGLEPTDWDSSDLGGVEVTGFTAIGSADKVLADLGDIYYFDLVPGAPMRFVRRASATVGSIGFDVTGAGVDQPAEPFTGLKIGNRDESPGVVGLSYANIAQDHDVDYQSGDRLTTDGPDVRRVQTNVVLTPGEARARAFSATVLQRSIARTASFGLSDTYAAAEPGDAYLVTDIDGNVVNLRIKRLTYADGVKQIDWELNDISALVDELDTETDYTEGITVAPRGAATVIFVDGPLLRDEDNVPGFYAVITFTGPGATLYGSADDSAYTSIGAVSRSATTGTCTELGNWTGGWVWDEVNTVTVTLGAGMSLSSSTRAAMYADETVNVALIGAHGRWELVRFRTATLSAPGVYVLSGFLRGEAGTEFAMDTHEAGDTFILAADNGLLSVSQLVSEIGVVRYFKIVPSGTSVASVSGVPFTCDSERLKPRAPVDLRLLGGLLTWDRRTRLSASAVGEPPLGEETESYDVELLDGSDNVIVAETVMVPECELQSIVLTQTGTLFEPGYAFVEIGTETVGIADPQPFVFLNNRRFVRHDSSGNLVAYSDNLGNEVTQWVNNGDTLYAVAQTFSPVHPNPYSSSRVVRYSRTAIGSAAATNTAATPGDYQGVAFDGTDVWVSEQTSGNLRRLNATTLVSSASYAVVDPGPLFFASGDLFTVCLSNDELVRWDIGTTAELYREPCITQPFDILVTGSLVFVLGFGGQLGVYNIADGSEVATYSSTEFSRYTRPQRNMAVVDGNVIVIGFLALNRFDATTGAFVNRLPLSSYADDVLSISEVDSEIVLCVEPVFAGSISLVVRKYQFDSTALTGELVRVYQNSATVGRGHVAELEL